MQKRQLAAILFADIEGYTTLMQENESLAIQKRNRFRKIIEDQVPAHNGKIIQYYGDGCLCLFNSGKEAVESCISIQSDNNIRDSIPVRMGIHLGDVTWDEHGAYGDTVNIAARIESFGVAGSVFLSRKVYDQVKNHASVMTTSLGKFQLKNVAIPIEIFVVSNPGFPVPQPGDLQGKGSKVNESIAVLPFENMSNDPEQTYFGEGISEEIINALVRLPGLKVAGRTSSFSFKGKDMDLREIGNQLEVSTVLEGSIRKSGNRIRVTAQLINVEDGFHLWSERYDRELEDIFAIQDDIAQNITNKLKLTLLKPQDQKPLIVARTNNIEAYQCYLHGRQLLDQRAHVNQAVSYFQKALVLDPNYALAHSGMAYAYFYQVFFGGISPTDAFPKARQSAKNAIHLDPAITEPYLIDGLMSCYYEWEFDVAEQKFTQALALNPQSYDTHRVLAYFYSLLNKKGKAVIHAKKAVQLDPLNINAKMSLGEILYRTHKFDQAIIELNKLLLDFPNYSAAYNILGNCYYFIGNHKQAVDTYNKISGHSSSASFYALSRPAILAEMGKSEFAFQMIDELKERQSGKWISPASLALLYLSVHETDKARESLELAFVEKDPVLMIVNIEPTWDRFRHLPFVQSILKNMGVLS
jgi:TolB-like protein/Tfp pilus assembly protein PilF